MVHNKQAITKPENIITIPDTVKASNCELGRTRKVRKAMKASATAMIDDLQGLVEKLSR